MKRILAVIAIFGLLAASAAADTPFAVISCAGDVSVSSTPTSIAVDTRGPSIMLKAASVKVYISQSGTAAVGSGHVVQIGENEVLSSTGPQMSLVAATSGTINVCYGSGN